MATLETTSKATASDRALSEAAETAPGGRPADLPRATTERSSATAPAASGASTDLSDSASADFGGSDSGGFGAPPEQALNDAPPSDDASGDVAEPVAFQLPPRPDAPSEAPRADAPVPVRLQSDRWTEALARAGTRSVQVSLGADGVVHLRTHRDGDGVAVSVRFSDPNLQALAAAHAGPLRESLEAHFAEPVRLALDRAADARVPTSDRASGGASGDASGGSSGSGSGQERSAAPRTVPTRPDAPTRLAPDPRPPRSSDRREWIG